MPGLPALPYMAAAAPGQEVTTTSVSARHHRASAFQQPTESVASRQKRGGVSLIPAGPTAGPAPPCPSTHEPAPSPGGRMRPGLSRYLTIPRDQHGRR